MDLWRVMFLLVVLLAVKVRCVSCPGDMWLETATPAPHLNRSAPLPEPHRNDSCDSHTVSCEPAESNGAKAVVGCWFQLSRNFLLLRCAYDTSIEVRA